MNENIMLAIVGIVVLAFGYLIYVSHGKKKKQKPGSGGSGGSGDISHTDEQ